MANGTLERAWHLQCANESCTNWARETNCDQHTAALRFRDQWDYVRVAQRWWCPACGAAAQAAADAQHAGRA